MPQDNPAASLKQQYWLLAAVPASAQDAHGAIAFGQIVEDEVVAYGFAWNYPARDEAQEAALNACLSASGGADCTVLAWFQNSCGALAVDQYGMAQGKGARTLEQAEARALATCEAAEGVGCAVVGSQCVSAGGQPDTWSGSESVLVAPEERSGPTAGAPRDEDLTREERIQVQQGLDALGFNVGPADGMFGPRTRSAIWEWQQAKGLKTTGYLSRDEAEVLAAAGAESREQPPSQETAEPGSQGNQVLYFMPEGPKCVELGSNLGDSDAGCWEEVPSEPGCYIWADSYPNYRIERWTGGCVGYTAHGRGTLSSTSSKSPNATGTGTVAYGKRNGHWVFRWADGDVFEGPYVNGKQNGHWVFRWASGTVLEGSIVDGEPHGRWVTRWASGAILEEEYRNGSREGRSGVYQTADGSRHPGRWSDGCFRDADGYAWYWGDGKTKEECRSR